MNETPTTVNEQEEQNIITPPKLQIITGGRDGDGNWLKNLSPGTVFLTAPKNRNPNYPPYLRIEFQVVFKTNDGVDVRLATDVESNNPIYQWVNTVEFCTFNDLKRILVDGRDIIAQE